MLNMRSIVVILLSLFIVKNLAAEIYYYKDSNGNYHFTDTPTNMLKYKPFEKKKKSSRIRVSTKDNIYDNLIKIYAKEFGFPYTLIKAMVKVESDFNPYALSPAGAIGLMQLMPDTAKIVGVKNIWSPSENLYGGVKYLRFLTDFFNNDIRKAIAAYNAGIKKVLKAKGVPNIVETKNYVKRVWKYYRLYEKSITLADKK